MGITNFITTELKGWTKAEIALLGGAFGIIFISAIMLKDNPIAIVSAVCGILYTIIAGKGKISCYFFGLCGSWCYIWLAFQNALWGNFLLYLFWYVPMQITGIFKWRKHLKKENNEIIKTSLGSRERIFITLLSILGCIFAITILFNLGDKNPIIDGITTVLSIVGMYLTVKRCIEQWIIWMIVNGLSVIMWLDIVQHGTKAYATVVMWSVYFILAIYFYIVWRKELNYNLCD